MSATRGAVLVIVLLAALAGSACGGGGLVDEDENVGPGPGILQFSHGGGAWYGSLPYWSVWVNGMLMADGSNLPLQYPIQIQLPGVPVGSQVEAFGFNTLGGQITGASGFLGPMGVVLQMY